ncbi:hypothetical protein Hanom_Chr05g00397781 [Helianthus anomalus]
MEGLILQNCERFSINQGCREFQKEKRDTYLWVGVIGAMGQEENRWEASIHRFKVID